MAIAGVLAGQRRYCERRAGEPGRRAGAGPTDEFFVYGELSPPAISKPAHSSTGTRG